MPLGNPIRKQNESRMVSVLATEGQTVFTVQGGYIINHISVFRNGVRLSPAEDFTAGDGSTVTLNDAANVEDRIDFHIFDRFTVQNAITGAASTQTINGDLVLNGKLFGELDVPSINLTGIITASNLNVTGISTFSNVDFSNLDVTGITTVGKQVHVGTGVSIAAGGLNVTAGISTFQAVQGTTGTFSAAVSGTTGTFSGAVSGTTGTFSGDVDIADKIIHTGDTNTAIRFPAADTVTVETGGSERARVDSSGSLLIGGTSSSGASEKLRIENDSATSDVCQVTIISGNAERAILNFGDAEDHNIGRLNYDNSDNHMSFFTNNNERVRITSGGDMGLGTNSPASSHDRVLTIAGTNSAELKLSGSNYGVTDTDGADVLFSYGGLYLINNESSGSIHFHTGSGVPERLRIKSDGTIGINTTTTTSILQIYGANEGEGTATGQITLKDTAAYNATPTGGIVFQGHHTTGSQAIFAGIRGFKENTSDGNYAGALGFDVRTHGAVAFEALRITSTGQILVGTTSDGGQYDGVTPAFVSEANSAYHAYSLVVNSTNAGHSGILQFVRSRGTSDGANTIVQSGDRLGSIYAIGADGTDRNSAGAAIDFRVDNTPGSNDMPGRIEFRTTADGSSTPTERMRIDNHGRVMIGNDQGSTQYADGGDDLVIGNTSGAHGITVISQNNNVGRLMFSDTYTSGTETYEGQILYSHALNTMNFYANYTSNQNIAMTIGGSNGDVTVHGGNVIIGTSGKGIDFSATGQASGMTNELLDDYEEGTWTPTCVPSGGDGSWPSSATQGYYVKVGSIVHVQFVFENFSNQLSTVQGSAGGSAVLTFGGLPFANQYYLYTPHIATWGFNYPGSLSTGTGSLYCYVADNTTNMQPYFVRDNATGEQVTVGALGQAYIRGQFSYRTSA